MSSERSEFPMFQMQPTSRMRARINAFTLVEILVVIGIIAVLIGILVPTVSKARESSRTAGCLSNLRQLTTAAFNYAADHNHYIVPVGNSKVGGSSYFWCNILVDNKYVGGPGDPGGGPQVRSIFFCPSGNQDIFPPNLSGNTTVPSSRTDERGAMAYQRLSTLTNITIDLWYGINGEDPPATNPTAQGAPCRRLQQAADRMTTMDMIKKPSEMVMLYDGLLYNIPQNPSRVNARHGKQTQTNIGFFDGHAETFLAKDLPGGMNPTSADFTYTNLQAKYPRPLWLLEQQY